MRSCCVIGVSLSPHWLICPMDFSVPRNKHRMYGTRRSYTCRQPRSVPDFDCCTARHPPFCRAQHLCWKWHPRVDVGRCTVLDAGPGSATLGKDIVPGHPQYFADRRAGGVDLDQARRHAGDGTGAQRRGMAFLYDPSGEIQCPPGVERVGRSPRQRPSGGTPRDDGRRHGRCQPVEWGPQREHHWTERAGAPLSTLLHAAATGGLPMHDVLRWIDRHNGAPALEILASTAGEGAPATDLLAGIVATDSREQSGYLVDRIRGAGRLPHGGCAHLDACGTTGTRGRSAAVRTRSTSASTGRRQRQFAPLVVAMVGDVRDAAYVRSRDGHAGTTHASSLSTRSPTSPRSPISPPWSARAAGQGLLVLACLQDLSQARGRWGQAADGFLSLFGTTVVLRDRGHRDPA